MQLRTQLLAKHIDGNQLALVLDIPELPAITRRGLLHMGADLMDGTIEV